VRAALSDTPVVVINGPRQAGKTTLVQHLDLSGSSEFVTLDDREALAALDDDPREFLRRPVDTLVIDEAQLAPWLFRAVKAEVDRDRRPGRFLVTGSSRLLSTTNLAEALVGRVETHELWPFSQDELRGTRSDVVDRLFEEPRSLLRSGALSRKELVDLVCAGGFPEAVTRNPRRRSEWYRSYVDATVESVVAREAESLRRAQLPRLMSLCAARTAQELNVSNVAGDLALPLSTVRSYLAQLEAAFLLWLVPAWSTNLSAKVVRRPKIMLPDSGLAAALLRLDAAAVDTRGGLFGPLLETFVANEVRKQVSWSDARPVIGHFRDRGGFEVDLVLEHPDGRIIGLEIKATSSPKPEDFRGLRLLADRLGDRFAYGAVLSASPDALPYGPKMAMLPVDVLWRQPDRP
jgi:uncharacterized protein